MPGSTTPLAPDLMHAHGESIAYMPSTILSIPTRPAVPQGRPRSIMDALHQLGVGNIQPNELGVPKDEKLLLSTRRITETDLARAIALHKDLRYVDLRESPPEHDVHTALSHRIIEDDKTIPWRREGGKLIVLTDNPDPTHLKGSIEQDAGEDVELAVAATSAIQATIQDRSIRAKVVQDLHADAARTAITTPDPVVDTADESDNAVIRTVNGLIEAAVARNASDIHLQPSANGLSVRLRVNGRLTLDQELPGASASAILTRVKLMAGMKPEQRDLPQDKRIVYRHGTVDVILRVNTLRTGHGGLEKIVMRVVPRNRPIPRLEDLDLNDRSLSVMREALTLHEGMILMMGPTGSGKTTTTDAMLNVLNSPDRNIQTIKQPIEFDLPGITQTPVNPEASSADRRLDVERALEALMRQDPDVIMVGEVRTRTTAGIAAQAGLNGHLVINTLHTGGAVATVRRLLDLGLEAFTIADTLRVVISQRLVGRPCPKCSLEVPAPASLYPGHTHRNILKSAGCARDTASPPSARAARPARTATAPACTAASWCTRCCASRPPSSTPSTRTPAARTSRARHRLTASARSSRTAWKRSWRTRRPSRRSSRASPPTPTSETPPKGPPERTHNHRHRHPDQTRRLAVQQHPRRSRRARRQRPHAAPRHPP